MIKKDTAYKAIIGGQKFTKEQLKKSFEIIQELKFDSEDED